MRDKNWVSQRDFWDFYLSQEDSYLLLKYDVDKKLWKKIFRKYVAVVNLEMSSYCNRVCDYCPVGVVERQEKEQIYLQEVLLDKILSELQEIQYNGDITVCLFNEPLADANIVDKIIKIKKACPNCFITMNSNGDYLTKDYLEKLENAGLGQIIITSHTLPGEKWIHEKKKEDVRKLCEKIGVPFEIKKEKKGSNITCEINHRGTTILVLANNWGKFGVDRGGTVQKLSVLDQQLPCLRPYREIVIAHDGCVRRCTCCYTSEAHFGHIEDFSLQEIYFSKRMVDLRRDTFFYGMKKSPHNTCRLPEIIEPYYAEKEEERKSRREEIFRMAEQR